MKIAKIHPRDLIALLVLIFSFILISKGINSLVSGIVIMIITFYFARRYDDENSSTTQPKEPETPKEIKQETTKAIPKPVPGAISYAIPMKTTGNYSANLTQ